MLLLRTDALGGDDSQYFANNNVSLYPMWRNAHCTCPGMIQDLSKLMLMAAVIQVAQTEPFSRSVPAPARSSLEAQEAALVAADIVEETEVLDYLAEVRSVLTAPGADVPKPSLDRLADLLLMHSAKSAGLEHFVDQIARMGSRYSEVALGFDNGRDGLFRPLFLFPYQSGSVPLLLRYNPHAVGLESATPAELRERVVYGGRSVSGSGDTHVLFSQLGRYGYTQDDFARGYRFFADRLDPAE
jgi:hypothetical protein